MWAAEDEAFQFLQTVVGAILAGSSEINRNITVARGSGHRR